MLAYRRVRSRLARNCVYSCIALVSCYLLSAGCDATIGPPPLGDPPDVDAANPPPPVPDAATPPPFVDAATPSPDAGPAPDAPVVLASCNEIYGQAPAFELCMQLEERCEFNAATAGGNCEDMCAQFGGVCIGAYDNDPGAPCGYNDPEECNDNRDDEICVCSRFLRNSNRRSRMIRRTSGRLAGVRAAREDER